MLSIYTYNKWWWAQRANNGRANSGRCKKEAWQYKELGSAHRIALGFWGGTGALTSVHSKVAASMGDCLDQGGIFRKKKKKIPSEIDHSLSLSNL